LIHFLLAALSKPNSNKESKKLKKADFYRSKQRERSLSQTSLWVGDRYGRPGIRRSDQNPSAAA